MTPLAVLVLKCINSEVRLTWTECVAGDLLHRHALTEGPAVQRCRVGAGPGSLLDPPPARHVTGGPLRPQGPAAVHWRESGRVREEKEGE